ncbi:MAG: TrkH family potassium uptake protein [Anaerovoracaceae bacterium]|nr:TrkH family potassium uptake protein [Bacillota bacterium]MDY2670521.1 TrkH family potassium uptake protein [Anaerovoracaceae bacterium]
MNIRLILYITGWILNIEAVFMVPSVVVSLIYKEDCLPIVFAILICAVCGIALVIKKPENRQFSIKEGYVAVAMAWLVMSAAGMLPFMFAGAIPNPFNAFFETVSGFTTTGASILHSVESVPKGLIFWRSMTHWIGGMGILVFLISVIPMVGGSKMNLMKAESSGPSVSRIMPTAKESARMLYKIYIGMTVIMVVLLLADRMPLFDALTITFGTAGTGGFGVLNDSCASYTTYQQVVVTVFMILFAVNFNVYFFALTRKFKDAFSVEEARWYLLIVAGATGLIAFDIRGDHSSIWQAIQQAAFQVASIISTTGYSTTDFNQWPAVSCTVLVFLMILGGCSGSTSGGLKVCRLVVQVKQLARELLFYLYPGSVRQIRLDGKKLDTSIIRSINVFAGAYAMIFAVSLLLISFDGFDFTTNFTAVAATLSNIGPGLGKVGPASNFDLYSDFSKMVLSFDMLAGRLEIFPILLFFTPKTWKKF